MARTASDREQTTFWLPSWPWRDRVIASRVRTCCWREDGRRAGTVSGGCLEAEVARRAWWLTSEGPVVERYSTVEDDGDRPYGSGCGGVVSLLLERRETAGPLMAALEVAFNARTPLAIATVLEGPAMGRRPLPVFHRSRHRLASAASAQPTVDLSLPRWRLWRWTAGPPSRRGFRSKVPRRGSGLTIVLRDPVCGSSAPATTPSLWFNWRANWAGLLRWLTAVRTWLRGSAFLLADEVRVLPIADLPDAAPAHLKPACQRMRQW